MLLVMELTRSDDIEYVHFHCFLESRMIRRYEGLHDTTPRLRITIIDNFFRHALTAHLLNIIQQPLAICEIRLGLIPN
jgi:hypothetical protein